MYFTTRNGLEVLERLLFPISIEHTSSLRYKCDPSPPTAATSDTSAAPDVYKLLAHCQRMPKREGIGTRSLILTEYVFV